MTALLLFLNGEKNKTMTVTVVIYLIICTKLVTLRKVFLKLFLSILFRFSLAKLIKLLN